MRYSDPNGCWVDNEDGTFTAEEGDTLWDLYVSDWQEKSGFAGDPHQLQPGQTVGYKQDNNSDQNKNSSFFSNHSTPLVSFSSDNGADAFYAQAGVNLDIKNGEFNLNAKAGVAEWNGSWQVLEGSHKFNFGLTGRASGFSADACAGMDGSLIGASAGFQVFKGGGTVDLTLFGVKFSIGGDIMAGGLGAECKLGKKGFKVGLDLGYGAGVQVNWEKVK